LHYSGCDPPSEKRGDAPKDEERIHSETTTDTEEQSCRAAILEENSSWGST